MYKKFVHAHVTIKAALLLTYLHVLTYLLIYQCIYIYIYQNVVMPMQLFVCVLMTKDLLIFMKILIM